MFGFAAKRQWVYAQAVSGRYQLRHRVSAVVLHLILFVTPWVMINGHPALRVDLPDRRLYAFGAIFTASDTLLLLLLLLFLAFSLFFFTSLFGRLWCGYGCPQTVFLEEWIRPVERWIEGDRVQRMRRDQGPWTLDKAGRKLAKWSAFLAVAFVLSMGVMSFFAGARELWTGQAGPTSYMLVAIFTASLFADFAWFREQFCNYLCPYARFQSALADEQSLVVTYDLTRGEPRGGPGARTDGRCLDCNKCVAVCPQGIDIRNGFQLECVACARCVDACEGVMGRIGQPSLVKYDTLAHAQEGRRRRTLRGRTVVYAGLLTAIAASGVIIVTTRKPFEAAVGRAPGTLFQLDADGAVRNTYFLTITNNDPSPEPITFTVRVTGLPDAQVITEPVRLASTEMRRVPLIIRVPATRHHGRTVPIEVHVASGRGDERIVQTTFKTAEHIDAAAF